MSRAPGLGELMGSWKADALSSSLKCVFIGWGERGETFFHVSTIILGDNGHRWHRSLLSFSTPTRPKSYGGSSKVNLLSRVSNHKWRRIVLNYIYRSSLSCIFCKIIKGQTDDIDVWRASYLILSRIAFIRRDSEPEARRDRIIVSSSPTCFL